MTSNIYSLFSHESAENAAVATVTGAQDGLATELVLLGTAFTVAGHLSSVDALNIGDRVLTISTEDGLIIAGRLRPKGEAPAVRMEIRNGHLELNASKSVRLQAGKHRIEVHTDGRIELNGRQISSRAEESIQLVSATVKLN